MSPTTMVSMAGSEVAAEAGVIDGDSEEADRDGDVDDVVHAKPSSHRSGNRGVKVPRAGVKKVSKPPSPAPAPRRLSRFHPPPRVLGS